MLTLNAPALSDVGALGNRTRLVSFGARPLNNTVYHFFWVYVCKCLAIYGSWWEFKMS